VGAGRVIVVGWRLPDFTTAGDPHRPNLEKLFTICCVTWPIATPTGVAR